jgi:hypothetical protein
MAVRESSKQARMDLRGLRRRVISQGPSEQCRAALAVRHCECWSSVGVVPQWLENEALTERSRSLLPTLMRYQPGAAVQLLVEVW